MQSVTVGGTPVGVAKPDGAHEEAQIVLVRSEVVDTVGHVLGNLFQRIYHLIEQVGTAEDAASRLHGSVQHLEEFLQLAMDYFSPLTPAYQYIPGADIAHSLARQISDASGCGVKLDIQLPLQEQVAVDPARLARAFGLLASLITPSPEPIRVQAAARLSVGSLVLRTTLHRSVVQTATSEAEMRWAVVEKLLEIHGGLLHENATAAGEVLWEIVLPLRS